MNTMFDCNQGHLWYQIIDKKSSKTVLLIHGFMEDHEVWDGLLDGIDANILLVDLIGFGKSKPSPDFDFSMKSHALAISSLLENLRLTEINVVGHSMGGYIALELATKLPQLKIGLLHSTCLPDSEDRKLNRNKTIEVLTNNADIFIREFYWNLFAEQRKSEFTAVVENLKMKASAITTQFIIQTVRGLRDRLNHELTWLSLQQKPLMIAGTFDKLIDVNDVKRLASLNQAQYVELSHSGHMGFYEEPEKVTNAINDWL